MLMGITILFENCIALVTQCLHRERLCHILLLQRKDMTQMHIIELHWKFKQLIILTLDQNLVISRTLIFNIESVHNLYNIWINIMFLYA